MVRDYFSGLMVVLIDFTEVLFLKSDQVVGNGESGLGS